MSTRTRSTRSTKALKENALKENKIGPKKKNAKVQRKPLADKTNSASDESKTNDGKKAIKKTVSDKEISKKCENTNVIEAIRPKRERKLPSRFIDNVVLTNISSRNNSSSTDKKSDSNNLKTPNKSIDQYFKSQYNLKDCSIVLNRPKRIHRLPSHFDDNATTPSKTLVQPCFASTPITRKVNGSQKTKPIKTSTNNNNSADSNNNAKKRTLKSSNVSNQKSPNNSQNDSRIKTHKEKTPSKSHKEKDRKLVYNNFSFKFLEENSPKKNEKLAVYDFTFDPAEEPVKKKRPKRAVKKKPPAKPKFAKVFSTKTNIKQIPVSPKLKSTRNKKNKELPIQTPAIAPTTQNKTQPAAKMKEKVITQEVVQINAPTIQIDTVQNEINDREPSPVRVDSPPVADSLNYDPLNLFNDSDIPDDASFLGDVPVACSSINTSVRHPLASPWRAEFKALPIKWPVNTYLKANMTPAVESSFIETNDNSKKHVYTNLVPQASDTLPEIVETENTNWKQTSIISFLKEAAEKSMKRKNRSLTPSKKKREELQTITPKKLLTPFKNASTPLKEIQLHSNSISAAQDIPAEPDIPAEQEILEEQEENIENVNKSQESVKAQSTPLKRKSYADNCKIPNKSPRRDKATLETCFGFDDSECQENVPPKKLDRAKALRPRSRAVLREINSMGGPTRAKLPVAAKTKFASSSDEVNKMFNDMKSATDAPQFPAQDKQVIENTNANATIVETSLLDDDESCSVHLFEDVDVIHHAKPARKSYGKSKKVTFCQRSASSDSDVQDNENIDRCQDNDDSEEDDIGDLSFKLPSVRPKKTVKKKKPKLSKKEEKEAEAWAAAFNSMCEDVEEFPLVVE